MASQGRTTLKGYFNTGDRPTESEFANLIDSAVNVIDDKATQTEAEAGVNPDKFMTPFTTQKSVLQFAPVKTVNSKTPSAGNVALTVADIPTLQTTLNGKQATLVSGTNIKSINGNSLLGSGDLELVKSYALASSMATTSTTRAAVTGLTFAAAAGKKYLVQILGEYQAAAVTTGGSLGFVLSAGAGTIKGTAELQGPTGSEKKLINAISTSGTLAGSFITSTGVAAISTSHYLEATLYFDCVTAGNFQVRWGSEVSGSSVTLMSGTVMIVTLLDS